MTLTPGTKIDGYEILGPLGAGGMGEVYRARDPILKREVAIKVLPAYVSQDPDRLRRFEQEAQAAAALNHPNILAVHRFGTFDRSPYLVSELLDGGTLGQLLSPGPLPVRKAIDYGIQIASGLAAAHEKGIVHRDLKPDNLFVTKDGRVKILDFGLAKLTESKAAPADTPTVTQQEGTEPGMVLGTVGYMSPEQVRGKTADHRADIFAFGAILYEMLTGKRAFRKPTSTETMTAILNEDPPAISQIAPGTSPGLLRIVHRCLEKDPEQRFHSASDLAFALEALSESGSSSLAVVNQSSRSRWIWVSVAAALAIFALVAGIAWRVKRAAPQPIVEKRITANPVEAPIRSAVISPDGKYIAYADPNGLYIRQLDTGEVRQLALPKEFNALPTSWFPDSTDLVVEWQQGKEQAISLWRLSILGGSPQKLMDDAYGAAVSPDGSHLVFARDHSPRRHGSDLWMMDSNGANARMIVNADEGLDPAYTGSRLLPVVWSPTGKRIAYIQHFFRSTSNPAGSTRSLWTRDSSGGDPHLVLSGSALGGALCWAADGRFLYSFHEDANGSASEDDVWAMQVDPSTGKPKGNAQRLAHGLGSIDALSVTANGKRVVFLRSNMHDEVFVAGLDPATRRLSAPFRLTLDENGNMPTAWTPDSKSVIFVSNRNGTWMLFKQPIDQTTAELVVEGRSIWIPRLSPDGSEVLYMEGYRPDAPSVPVSIMRMNLAGGAPREVLRENGIVNLQCARIPSRLCLFNTVAEATTTFFSFDPERGKSAEIARMSGVGGVNWSLSPDGSLLAIIPYGEREDRIRFLSLPAGVARDVVVKDWPRLFSVDWSADGAGLLIPSATSNWGTPVLLFVDLEGKARVLWEGEKYGPLEWTIPSPDGRHLALMRYVGESNVWMLENY